MTDVHQLLQITHLYVFTKAHVTHHVQYHQLLMLFFSERGMKLRVFYLLRNETEYILQTEICKPVNVFLVKT